MEAPVRRALCVELPAEAREECDEDMVGLLPKSLYGTRDASANFQEEVRKVMSAAGFRRNRYNPSAYYHAQRQLRTMVHGDDFVTSGPRSQLRWLKGILEARFEVSTTVVGTRARC